MCLDILIPSVTKFVNHSLSEGFVTTRLNKAVVISLTTAAGFQELLTCGFISKLVECMFAPQLNVYVIANALENVKQPTYKLAQ